MSLVNYSIYCKTENRYYTTYSLICKPPKKCPINAQHVLDHDATNVINTLQSFYIEQQNGLTSGSYSTRSVSLTAQPNTTTETYISWPHPVCPKTMSFTTDIENKGDILSVIVGEHTTVSYITTPVAPASGYNNLQNYNAGDIVTFTHPKFGARVYTCKQTTTNNESPLNSTFWQLGYPLHIGTTDHIEVGYFIRLTDGVNVSDMNTVVAIDRENNIIYVYNNPDNSYLPTSPTYVQISVYPIKDFLIGSPGKYTFGTSIFSSSYVPTDIVITIRYQNNTGTEKFFSGQVEYFY